MKNCFELNPFFISSPMKINTYIEQGRIQGAPLERFFLGGALDFQNLKRKSTSLTTAIERDKEEERKKKKYIVSGVMMAKE